LGNIFNTIKLIIAQMFDKEAIIFKLKISGI